MLAQQLLLPIRLVYSGAKKVLLFSICLRNRVDNSSRRHRQQGMTRVQALEIFRDIRDIQRYTEIYRDIQRYTEIYRDIQRYTEIYRDIQRIQRYTEISNVCSLISMFLKLIATKVVESAST